MMLSVPFCTDLTTYPLSNLFCTIFLFDLVLFAKQRHQRFLSSTYQESSKNFSACGENPSVPMEILNQLTLHNSWIWETKVIILTCKTAGGRNPSLYLDMWLQ